MRVLILPLALTAGFACPTPADARWTPAVERQLSRSFHDCMNSGAAGRGTTAGMMDCHGEEIAAQDARLNQAYRMVMQRLSTARKTQLRARQRAWIKQRDQTCDAEYGAGGGGSLARVIYARCILRVTIERRLWLERYR